MNVQGTAGLLGAASAALALASGAAGAAPGSCAPAGAHVVRAAGAARLYTQGSTLYGCFHNRRTRLGTPHSMTLGPGIRIDLYTLSSGGYAGIDRADMGVDTFSSTVALIDLRTGASVATAPATTPENRAESFLTVTAIVIDPHGTLAWIGRRSAIGVTTPTLEVHTLSASAPDRLIASSATIAATSLRLHGETISWTDAGHTKTATL